MRDTAAKVEAVALVVAQVQKKVEAAEKTDSKSANSSSPLIEAATRRALEGATLPP